jgi:hypothetical protein
MLATRESLPGHHGLAQAAELAELLDAEACWENLRKTPGDDGNMAVLLRDLTARQRAYEAFRTRLTAYNARHKPAHLPELMLNNPIRLGTWCGKLRDLFRLLEQDSQAPCPLHLVEKAYRAADRIGERQETALVERAPRPASVAAAIRVLETVAEWCAGQASQQSDSANRAIVIPLPPR